MDVPLLFKGRKSSRSKVEEQLSEPVRAVLDQWAEAAERLDFRIALGETGEYVVLGHADDEVLIEAVQWMDASFRILDPLVPVVGPRPRKATVAILFDQDLSRSPGWAELLAELQQRKLLITKAADYLRANPEGLTLRQAPMFLQPTYDLTGEGEFRLGNEVAHKFAQCLVTIRTGQQPSPVLWGLGYVVEQQLFQSSYHFRLREFVYSSSHFDWQGEAERELDAHRKDKQFSLASLLIDEESAGKPAPTQILAWGTLAYLAQHEPQTLSELLRELSGLHAAVDARGVSPFYSGDPAQTREALTQRLEVVAPSDLRAWLDGKKPKKKSP